MPLALIMVGLPARGKTYTARRIARHLDWLGFRTHVFNVGNYRREMSGAQVPHHFFDPQNEAGLGARIRAAKSALTDMIDWFQRGGEVGVFDATNSTEIRRLVAKNSPGHDIECAYIESICLDEQIIETNNEAVNYPHPIMLIVPKKKHS